MKITLLKHGIKCDTALCDLDAKILIDINSYKDNLYLCEKCFLDLKNTIKRIQIKNEKE